MADPETRTVRRDFRGAGLTLVADTAGDPESVPIVFWHGGGQTRASWGRALPAMAARGLYAVSIDMRGHGESDRAPDGDYRLERFAEDIRALMEQLASPAFLVGASLGGLASLLAVTGPHSALARGLVLVDVAPKMESEGVDKIVGFMRAAPDGFASLEEAAESVASYLPHRRARKNLDGLRKNLRQGADGRWRWHWDPRFLDGKNASHAREHQAQLEDAAKALTIPTMLLRGGMSQVVSIEGAREFLAITPHAELVDIADAEHMIAGDKNDAFDHAVASFVDRHMQRRPTTPLIERRFGGDSGS